MGLGLHFQDVERPEVVRAGQMVVGPQGGAVEKLLLWISLIDHGYHEALGRLKGEH